MVVFHRHDDYVGYYYNDICATKALLLPTTDSQSTITIEFNKQNKTSNIKTTNINKAKSKSVYSN